MYNSKKKWKATYNIIEDKSAVAEFKMFKVSYKVCGSSGCTKGNVGHLLLQFVVSYCCYKGTLKITKNKKQQISNLLISRYFVSISTLNIVKTI